MTTGRAQSREARMGAGAGGAESGHRGNGGRRGGGRRGAAGAAGGGAVVIDTIAPLEMFRRFLVLAAKQNVAGGVQAPQGRVPVQLWVA